MKYNLNISKDYYDILVMFGDINDVIDKVLKIVERGEIDIDNLPDSVVRGPKKHIVVNIDSEWYEHMQGIYGPTSPRISISRLLYYFVDNELYVDYDWKIVRKCDDKTSNKLLKILDDVDRNIGQLKHLVKDTQDYNKLEQIYKDLYDIINKLR